MKKRVLVLPTVAVLALLGCTSHTDTVDDDSQVRNTYDSVDDCKKDNSDKDCERVVVHDRVYYYGPWMPYNLWYGYGPGYFHTTTVYSSSSQTVTPRAAAVEAHAVSVSRGGFGSTAAGAVGE